MKLHTNYILVGLCAQVMLTSSGNLKTAAWIRKLFCLGFLPLLIPSAMVAATANVDIEPTAFVPDTLTINVNDQVV